jgi:putative transposase
MGRPRRTSVRGYLYHVLNRGNGRPPVFYKDFNFEAFIRVLTEAHDRLSIRLLAYCIMSNHWRLVLWPTKDRELSEFMRWLTVSHTQRWHAHFHTQGTGPLYQGRFKSFPVAANDHLLTVLRYVDRNPLLAGLVSSACKWRCSSLGRTCEGLLGPPLKEGPIARPANWPDWVDETEMEAELAALRHSIVRGAPFGSEPWQKRTAQQLGLQSSLKSLGRPTKHVKPQS